MNTFKNEIDFHQFNQHNKNSKRTRIVNENLNKSSNPKKRKRKGHAGKRDKFKYEKLQKLDKSCPTKLSEQKVVDINQSFEKGKNVYFSGKVSAHIGTHKEGDGIVLSAQKDCDVVDDEGHFNGIVGYDNDGNVVFVFTETFCNDHVKCVLVFPTKLETMSISTTTGDDVEFHYSVRTTPVHSWMKWVTVKRSLLIKEGDDDGKLMGLFADRRFKKEDIIGVYLGKFRKEMEIHAYQLGNIDAVKGLGGKPYMGMHFMNDPNIDTEMKTKINISPNALGWNNGEVKATTPIIEGEEFLLDY